MLLDSETPVAEIERTWEHLRQQDGWEKPESAGDDHVLLMVTCTESWIVADRATLESHYGSTLQQSALPPVNDLESRDRESVQNALTHATRRCSNAYAKGKRSFELIGELDPAVLTGQLPSFARMERVLNERL